MIYTMTLNPALDYVMRVEKLRRDDINRSSSEALYCGGKGINVSTVLNRLGLKNRALGFVAGFTGDQIIRMLSDEGIEADFVKAARGLTRINVKIKAETELDINARGPEISEKEIGQLFEKLDSVGAGDVLVLAGAPPKNLPADIYEKMMQRLNGKGVRFVVDAEGELLLRSLKYRPFLIKPNHHELGDLFGTVVKEEDEIVFYAKKLQEQGAVNVLVSRGGDGAVLLDEKKEVHRVGVVPGKVLNTVGSGDSMVAGFLAGYLQSASYAFALRLGAACGNATACSEGLAEKAKIDEVFNKIK